MPMGVKWKPISRCGQLLLSSRPAELWWTRVEGIQKQAFWIEVHFLQTFSVALCVPLARLTSISLALTRSRTPLSGGKISGVKSMPRGSTGRHKLPWKVALKCLHSCANRCPRRPVTNFVISLFLQVLKRELYDHKVRAQPSDARSSCISFHGRGRPLKTCFYSPKLLWRLDEVWLAAMIGVLSIAFVQF